MQGPRGSAQSHSGRVTPTTEGERQDRCKERRWLETMQHERRHRPQNRPAATDTMALALQSRTARNAITGDGPNDDGVFQTPTRNLTAAAALAGHLQTDADHPDVAIMAPLQTPLWTTVVQQEVVNQSHD